MEIQDPLMEVRGKNKKINEKGKMNSDSNLVNIEELELAMKAAAAQLDFEEAARLRDIIRTSAPR
jgi:excinuclease ABC subunit B